MLSIHIHLNFLHHGGLSTADESNNQLAATLTLAKHMQQPRRCKRIGHKRSGRHALKGRRRRLCDMPCCPTMHATCAICRCMSPSDSHLYLSRASVLMQHELYRLERHLIVCGSHRSQNPHRRSVFYALFKQILS